MNLIGTCIYNPFGYEGSIALCGEKVSDKDKQHKYCETHYKGSDELKKVEDLSLKIAK